MNEQAPDSTTDKPAGFDYSFALFLAALALVVLYLVVPKNEQMSAIAAGKLEQDQRRANAMRDAESLCARGEARAKTNAQHETNEMMCADLKSRVK